MTSPSTPQRVLLFTEQDPLVLANGEQLTEVEIAYQTWGTLNEDASNAVFIAHALTGDANAAGWWSSLVGPGRPVDTDRFFVICPNLLGGCSGSTGPRSTNPATGTPYGLDFPLLAMTDLVAAHRRLIAHLGITRLHAAVGGSLGGMQLLQWSIEASEEIGRAVLVAATSRLTAENIAFSAVARAAITGDPGFENGQYAVGAGPRHGMAIARMMAHITYVSPQSLETKFGRRLQGGQSTPGFGVDFEVESYLDHQGRSFLERFDALTYLYFTRVMDYFDPFADPAAASAITDTTFLVLSFDSDWRFGTQHSVRIEEELAAAGVEVTRHELPAPHGHDSFLFTVPGYQETVRDFLA
ncbi:homoserine O-acetyltransferase [Nocardioides daedukensis]|uniref:Homoserine O-succinyltransferase n=1 Tax=Nocardioides daedukensis TaxID=634462 RepID=A0A7Y9UVR5_9ACTN|nr:homoserine O-acetyltransferase [Nocardioides daedukensis]